MRIACISTSAIPSTTANSIQAMKACHALAQLGHEVQLWVPGSRSEDWDRLASRYGLQTAFDVEWLKSPRIFHRYDFALNAFLHARGWHVGLVYTWMPQAALLALLSGLPAVLELHDRPAGKLGPWMVGRFFRHPGRKRLLVITQALRQALEKSFGAVIDDDGVRVAPNGVELERYDNLPEPAAARRELGLPEKFTAGYSGHFYPGRGTELLVHLAKNFPQVNFLWVGGRPQEVAVWKTRLQREGMNNIMLTGFIENRTLPRYQAAAEVLLMPYERSIAGSSGGNSADICSPMKMFEYLATGRAILASDLPVLHEVLNAGNAIFCNPDEPQDWVKALEELLTDEPCRQRLAMQAGQDAARYTWKKRAEMALEGLATE